MKHILDSSFRYKPSFDTDVRKTFERVRRQQQTKVREQSRPGPDAKASDGAVRVKVLQLDQLKKANGS
ncbi:MAG TPA: hypothetical protein VHL85_10850 [Burkholderiales bacterium]|jgi:hypothetical protein|nr:hypothetical protein [Burkholderiales bacterium]